MSKRKQSVTGRIPRKVKAYAFDSKLDNAPFEKFTSGKVEQRSDKRSSLTDELSEENTRINR